jgi:hypothetical protein
MMNRLEKISKVHYWSQPAVMVLIHIQPKKTYTLTLYLNLNNLGDYIMTTLQTMVLNDALERCKREVATHITYQQLATVNLPTDQAIREMGYEGAVDIIVADTAAAQV